MIQGQVDCRVLIQGSGCEPVPGLVAVQTFTPSERKVRALKMFGLFFVLSVFSFFIPLAHFVLVPLFLILGLIVAAVTYSSQSIVLGGEGICPYCQAALKIVRMADQWPLEDRCSQCQRSVTIERA